MRIVAGAVILRAMNVEMKHSKGRGVVAAGDPQTAAAGTAMLEAGGNAIDAAVASGFAAFVCEVALCGPLGGGVMVTRLPNGEEHAIDFFARGPGLGGSSPGVLDFGEATIDFGVTRQTFRVGRGAAALGLAMPGLLEVHRRWGKLPLDVVAEPAVRFGREGYIVGPPMAYILELIAPIFAWTPESKALCFNGDQLPNGGDRLWNRALGDVLEAVAASPDTMRGIYDQFCREFGPENGGLITPEDVKNMEIAFSCPVSVDVSGWSLATMSAPSVGGILIALGLRLLEGIGERHEFLSASHMCEVAAIQRLLLQVRHGQFDDRIADPAFIQKLLSSNFVEELRRGLGEEREHVPFNPLGSTTQISVVDGDGGMVAMTLTNGEGCGHVLGGTGIEVNNLLGEDDINPRGFHAIPPGQPMITMMAPTIGRGPDGSCVALGSGGSNRLRNAILQSMSHLMEFDASFAAAVLAPRVHVEAKTEGFELNVEENGLDSAVLESLKVMFPNTTVFPDTNMFFGGVHLAGRTVTGYDGMGDPRRGGAVALARPRSGD
jgi:gamma-glutamyltranspeptidase/glutathione hydrolase